MEDSFTIVSGKATIVKDPNAVLDYYVNLTDWMPVGDTVASVNPIATGVVVDSHNITGAGLFVQLWCSGGVAGVTGNVVVRFTTAGGRTDDRTLYFKMKQR